MAIELNPITGKFDVVEKDHTNLSNIGTNTHSTIDSHLAATTAIHGATSRQSLTSETSAVETIYVNSATGNDTTGTGTSALPYLTIQKAIDVLGTTVSQHTVIALSGTFTLSSTLDVSRLNILASLTIRGEDSAGELSVNDTASGGGNNYLDDSGMSWATDRWAGGYIWIYYGTGRGQYRAISSNTGTRVTVSVNWATNPDNTSRYVIVKSAINGNSALGSAVTATRKDNLCFQGLRFYGFTSYAVVWNSSYNQSTYPTKNNLIECVRGLGANNSRQYWYFNYAFVTTGAGYYTDGGQCFPYGSVLVKSGAALADAYTVTNSAGVTISTTTNSMHIEGFLNGINKQYGGIVSGDANVNFVGNTYNVVDTDPKSSSGTSPMVTLNSVGTGGTLELQDGGVWVLRQVDGAGIEFKQINALAVDNEAIFIDNDMVFY